jgi:30S ribosomal protein S31
MGKGDKKSKRGKINNGSYGKRRPRKASKTLITSEEKSKK